MMVNALGRFFFPCLISIVVLAAQSTVKRVPLTATAADDGAAMYKAYCASCHGMEGKGDGPAAAALKARPTDLTQLARKNGGQFPTAHFYQVLREELNITAHGSRDMPVWGTIVRQMERNDEGLVRLRMKNLTGYVESRQAK